MLVSASSTPGHGPLIDLPNNWRCRPYQDDLWSYFENGGKRAVAVWHRRAGKDSLALNRFAVAQAERQATYWHMLPQAAQARKAIWEAINPHTGVRLIDQAFPHEIRETTRENEMFIRFKTGSTWQVVGSDNFNSLVGSPPAGIVFSEYALADPRAWAILRPILRENGGWALFISTPRGKNHLHSLLKMAEGEDGWFAQVLNARQTGVFTEGDLEQEKREYISELGEQDGTSMFEQEYLCSFEAAIVGAYYAKWLSDAQKEGRIGKVPHEPQLPVETWWDLGIDDATSLWFVQRHAREVRIIDHYRNSGEGLAHYAKVCREKPYIYRRHVLPHDIKVRELGSGLTRLETLQKMLGGASENFIVSTQKSVADGINAVRTLLPRCWFDAEKCAAGLEAMRQYRREWDEDRRTFLDRPYHDWTSHDADAFRTGAIMDATAPMTLQTQKLKYDNRGIV